MATSKLIGNRSKKSTVLVSTRTLQDAIRRANELVDSLMETNPNDPNINKVEAAVQHMSQVLNVNPQQMKQDGAMSVEDYMDNSKMPEEAMKLKNEVDMISKLQSRGGMQQQVNYVPDSAVEQGVNASQKQADGSVGYITDRDEQGEARVPELLAVPRLAKKKKEAVPEEPAAAMPAPAPAPAAGGVNPSEYIPTEALIKVIEDLPKEEDFAQNQGKQDALIELTNVLKSRPVLPPEPAEGAAPAAPAASTAPGLAAEAPAVPGPVAASAKKRADLGDHAMSQGETINNGSGAAAAIGNGGTSSTPKQISTDSGISRPQVPAAPEKAPMDLGGLNVASAEKIARPARS